ncbi:MAG: family 43 glycosylhydrolase, partial [Bacteroidota bacterium]|nr:family 43 glycosylhydrolase [Bacteroidota bacterium]
MASTPVFRYSLSFIAFIYCISFPCILSCKSSIAETPEKTDTTNKYLNPVFIPVFADPAVIRGDDGWFYAYGTEDNWSVNELHLIPIIRSRDLVKWHFMNDAFSTKPTWKNNGMLWAPNVNKINGKYYMYYAYSLWGDSNPGIGLAISNTPLGPFNDYGKIFTSTEIGVENSIDPFFFQENGHNYLFWGSFRGIFGVELAPDGKSVSGEKFQIAGNAFEASYIYKRGAY